MSATEALKLAHAAGIHFKIDGEDLVLGAPAPPPPALLSLLSRHKADILALLKPAEDWRTLFEERAALAVFGFLMDLGRSEPPNWAGGLRASSGPGSNLPMNTSGRPGLYGIYRVARSCRFTKMGRRSWIRTEGGVTSIDVLII